MLCLCMATASGQTQRLRYEEGDWVSYTDFRYVTSISVGPQYVYFGTTGGITRYDRYLNRWDTPYTTSDGLSESWIARVAFDPASQYLWCQTRNGFIDFYQPTEKQWHRAGSPPPDLLFQDPPALIYPDFFTEFEYTFLANGPEASIQDRNLRTYPVQVSAVDGWDNMWIGTWGLNAGKGDIRTQRLQMLRFGLIESSVAAMILDGPVMWFGGIGELQGSRGITRYHRRSDEWTYYEARYIDTFRSDNVTSMAANNQYLWLGTYEGLVQFDKKKNSWKTSTILDGLSDNEVLDLALDRKNLWIGTAFGLSSLNTEMDTMQKVAHDVLASSIVYEIEIENGTIWAATNHGLYTLPRGHLEWEPFVDREDHLGGVVSDIASEGSSVWFAAIPSWAAEERLFLRTQAGRLDTGRPRVPGSTSLPIALFLSRFNAAADTWEQHFPPGTYAFSTINDLAVDDSSAWIATDEGVLKYDRRWDRWRHFTAEDGLLDNMVQTLLLDGDYVWFGTPRGVTRFFWNDPYRID